jgi:hypothetical protein
MLSKAACAVKWAEPAAMKMRPRIGHVARQLLNQPGGSARSSARSARSKMIAPIPIATKLSAKTPAWSISGRPFTPEGAMASASIEEATASASISASSIRTAALCTGMRSRRKHG